MSKSNKIQTDVIEVKYNTETGEVYRVKVNRNVTPGIDSSKGEVIEPDKSSFGGNDNYMIAKNDREHWDIILGLTLY